MKIFIPLMGLLISFSTFALKMVDGQVILDKFEDYEQCQKLDYGGTFCQDALERWVASHEKETSKAAKATRKVMNPWVALPLFRKALDLKQIKCSDEDLKLAVIDGLSQTNEKTVKLAHGIAFKDCPGEMKSSIAEGASLGSPLFTNTCKELLKLGLISGLKAKKCDKE
jgi:hypothetical protein